MVLALLLAAGLVGANNVAERRELDRLLTRVDDAQDAVAYSNHRIAATVDYTLPLLFRASVDTVVRTGLQQLVEDTAAGQIGMMQDERDKAQRVRVLPWHRALRRAKTALLAYLDARVAYLRTVAADQETLYVVHPELDRSLDAVRRAFRSAGGAAQRSRIDAAFAGGTHPA